MAPRTSAPAQNATRVIAMATHVALRTRSANVRVRVRPCSRLLNIAVAARPTIRNAAQTSVSRSSAPALSTAWLAAEAPTPSTPQIMRYAPVARTPDCRVAHYEWVYHVYDCTRDRAR